MDNLLLDLFGRLDVSDVAPTAQPHVDNPVQPDDPPAGCHTDSCPTSSAATVDDSSAQPCRHG